MTNLEEIKSRLNIVDVIQEYLPLKKAGANWKAPCPFHHEKSPSFMVSDTKQIWHCFGCNEGSDVFGFVMKMEGVDFPEALKMLAKKAGVELKHEDPKYSNLKTKAMEATDQAAKFFHAFLMQSAAAAGAREYLARRGLTEVTIKDWQIGFAPNAWEGLIQTLAAKGYKPEDLASAGLAIKSDKRLDSYYDRFRNRIMFPIRDVAGNVRGFTGRIMPEDETKPEVGGKYVNSPETIIYNKGHIVYGLDKAKLAVKAKNEVVVVEGQMDVIASHQAGVANVVASSGTAFTPEQFRLLRRYADTIILSFDTDLAGQSATYRGIDEALRAGFTVRVIAIDRATAKDADELIKKDAKLWDQAIAESEHIMDFYIKKAKEKFDLSRVEQKSKAIAFVLTPLNHMQNDIEKSLWRKKIAEGFGVEETSLQKNLAQTQIKTKPAAEPAATVFDRQTRLSDQVLMLLLNLPNKLPAIMDTLDPKMIKEGVPESLYRHLIIYYNDTKQNGHFSVVAFRSWLNDTTADAQLQKSLDYLLLGYDHFFGSMSEEEKIQALQNVLRELRNQFFHLEKKKIEQEMHSAEKANDRFKIEDLTHRFHELLRRDNLSS